MNVPLRSRRGQVGTSPLAVSLRELLEAQMPPSRATSGKRAARAGQVQWIDIAPGAARAEVRDEMTGNGVLARLDVRPILPGDREVLLRIAHAHPELPARLVAGQFPADVAAELEAEEISLLPRGIEELSHDCSCHDWPGPCVHVAALAYVLVEAVDADPTVLLTLRGVTLEDLAAPIPRGGAGAGAERSSAGAPAERAGASPAADRSGAGAAAERGDAAAGTEPSAEPMVSDREAAAPGDDEPSAPADASDTPDTSEAPDASSAPGAHDAPEAPRFDPSRADAALLVDALGMDVARVLARFYGAADPAAPDAPGS